MEALLNKGSQLGTHLDKQLKAVPLSQLDHLLEIIFRGREGSQ
jgi:hypothetical protein